MQFLKNKILASKEMGELLSAISRKALPACLSGVSSVHKAVVISALCADISRPFLVLAGNEAEAFRIYEDLQRLGENCCFYPARDFNFHKGICVSGEYEQKRIAALWELACGKADICVACVDAAIQYTLPREVLEANSLALKIGQDIETEKLMQRLIAMGYTRCEQVDGIGQFALRGGIFDFFPPQYENPVRIELFGDEIETISLFDTSSQRRIAKLREAFIIPATEKLFEKENLIAELEKLTKSKKLSEDALENLEADIYALENGGVIATDKYMGIMFGGSYTLFDYVSEENIFISETGDCEERLQNTLRMNAEDITALLEEGIIPQKLNSFTLDKGQFVSKIGSAVYLETFTRSHFPIAPKALINLAAKQFSPWQGSVDALCEELSRQKGWLTIILAGNKKAAKNLYGDLCVRDIPAILFDSSSAPPQSGIAVCDGILSAGFEFPSEKLTIITAGGKTHEKKSRPALPKNAARISSLTELKIGDYVVHAAHGIGVFEGIQKMRVENVFKDYIKIRYDKGGSLYVPVTQLDMVSKYVGAEEGAIKLNKLGGGEWKKTRSRVRAAVKDLADQLTKLYAKRLATKGYAFSKDTDLQSNFEARFEYEETPDQLRCINEIKKDMERAVPMDRLLCGDVGFGKTEVALRAAFKCMSEGRQVALLVPTTILASQHYETVLKRIGDLPLKIELLSRFVSPKKQERILKDITRGRVDMVVGTHRLISKDVQFKDLGLVIIDEEQRFGVAQKERLKELFPTVDVLTLSATPIPRTLNMAVSGLRDMSTIEEAPQDRYPVQTYVMEQNNSILADAITKELRRGGQVYYLHNRVESIDACAARLKSRLPDCRIATAHGQMTEEELSAVWRKLLEQEIDVLVCTTIIESGIDVPNVNTIIIEDANRFGLAQLHQLRGRVGRSHRRAYAYICFRPESALSEIASKRLDAIRQFTEFGSGFQIAMRDLEIRGAGSILGGEQHGHLESVGYDMYLKMLADAVAQAKGEDVIPEKECSVDIQENALIPENYIRLLPARMGIYRRIADIRVPADAEDVKEELNDRFGAPPAAVINLIDIALQRRIAASRGITEIIQKEGRINFTLEVFDSELLFQFSERFKGRVKVMPGATPVLSIRLIPGDSPLEVLREALRAEENF